MVHELKSLIIAGAVLTVIIDELHELHELHGMKLLMNCERYI